MPSVTAITAHAQVQYESPYSIVSSSSPIPVRFRLPPDLESILKMAANRGEVDSAHVAAMLNCNDRTARTKLRRVADQGLLTRRGNTKGTTYVLG